MSYILLIFDTNSVMGSSPQERLVGTSRSTLWVGRSAGKFMSQAWVPSTASGGLVMSKLSSIPLALTGIFCGSSVGSLILIVAMPCVNREDEDPEEGVVAEPANENTLGG